MVQLNVDFLSYEKIASEAQRFLVKFGHENSIPIPIEEIVEYKLKADIIPILDLHRSFDIDGATSSDLSTIYVDEFVYMNRPTRYRFTLAHESGHIFLHEPYFRQLDFDSVQSWKEIQTRIDPDDYSKMEYQGYAFGGLVLVPRHQLKAVFEDNISKIRPLIEKVQRMGLSRDTYIDSAIDRMASILAPIFDVSTGVMVRRIGFDKLEGLIP